MEAMEDIKLTLSLSGEALDEDLEQIFDLERVARQRITETIHDSYEPNWPLRNSKTFFLVGLGFRISWNVPNRRITTLVQFRALAHGACDRVTQLVADGGEIVFFPQKEEERLAA